MAFLLLNVFTFLCLGLVASHAAVEPSEVYWKSVLPNTPIPKALKDLLHPPEWSNKVGGNGKPIDYGVIKTVEVKLTYNKNNRRSPDQVQEHNSNAELANKVGGKGKPVDFGDSKKVEVKFSYPFKPKSNEQANVGESKTVEVTFTYKKPNMSPDQVQEYNSKAAALFFLEKDMLKGTKMNLHFSKSTTPFATFLPRQLANNIPFSSNKFPEILKYFSLKPTSMEAGIMKDTISECEEVAMKDEEKQCPTSLESMIDFSTSKLGEKVNAISTEADKESDQLQEYTVVGVKKMGGGKAVACHKQKYVYAVFYCHSTLNTKAYTISLMGKSGARAKAVAVCHTDTKDWDADYIAFKVLNVKPGTIPICHFLPEDHVIWVPY